LRFVQLQTGTFYGPVLTVLSFSVKYENTTGVTEDASDDNVIMKITCVKRSESKRETESQRGWLNESEIWFQREADTHRKEQFAIFREKKIDGQV